MVTCDWSVSERDLEFTLNILLSHYSENHPEQRRTAIDPDKKICFFQLLQRYGWLFNRSGQIVKTLSHSYFSRCYHLTHTKALFFLSFFYNPKATDELSEAVHVLQQHLLIFLCIPSHTSLFSFLIRLNEDLLEWTQMEQLIVHTKAEVVWSRSACLALALTEAIFSEQATAQVHFTHDLSSLSCVFCFGTAFVCVRKLFFFLYQVVKRSLHDY